MSKNYAVLCGVTFELYRNRKSDYESAYRYEKPYCSNYSDYYRLKDLGECYANPSQAKRNIYSYWRTFFIVYVRSLPKNTVKRFEYGVSGYNSATFTFVCFIEFYNSTRRPTQLFTITPAHNRLALLDDFA